MFFALRQKKQAPRIAINTAPPTTPPTMATVMVIVLDDEDVVADGESGAEAGETVAGEAEMGSEGWVKGDDAGDSGVGSAPGVAVGEGV